MDKGYNLDVPQAVNLPKLSDDLGLLLNRYNIVSPRYDYDTCASIPNSIPVPAANNVIVDSIFALNPALNLKAKPVVDLKMFVDVSKQELWRRYAKRSLERQMDEQATKTLFAKANAEADKHLKGITPDLRINREAPLDKVTILLSEFIKILSRKN